MFRIRIKSIFRIHEVQQQDRSRSLDLTSLYRAAYLIIFTKYYKPIRVLISLNDGPVLKLWF